MSDLDDEVGRIEDLFLTARGRADSDRENLTRDLLRAADPEASRYVEESYWRKIAAAFRARDEALRAIPDDISEPPVTSAA
jgi:hypothetical protein